MEPFQANMDKQNRNTGQEILLKWTTQDYFDLNPSHGTCLHFSSLL